MKYFQIISQLFANVLMLSSICLFETLRKKIYLLLLFVFSSLTFAQDMKKIHKSHSLLLRL